jgi:hypothetical protein
MAKLLPMVFYHDCENESCRGKKATKCDKTKSFRLCEYDSISWRQVKRETTIDGKSTLKSKRIISDTKIIIKFDYPLEKSTQMKFVSKRGFSMPGIVKCINKGYRTIYANPSKYKPSRHELVGLFLEEVFYDSEKKLVTMSIGS